MSYQMNANALARPNGGDSLEGVVKLPKTGKLQPIQHRKSGHAVRLVPNGQVYKQIFDAEVQLVKSLRNREEARIQRENTKILDGANANKTAAKVPGQSDGIPLVNNHVTDVLSERQKTWMHALPNDGLTENPIAYKHALRAEEMRMSASFEEERRHVRGLPDVLPPIAASASGAAGDGGIIAKIAASRKERHEAALEDMRQELAGISAEVEPQVSMAGEDILSFLSDNDKLIEGFLVRIDDDFALGTLQLEEILQVWREVEKQSEIRREAIHKLDEILQKLESDRIGKIRSTFTTYGGILESIAHLMPEDVSHILDAEAAIVNGTIINNARAYGDLFTRLMTADIEREKYQHKLWQKRMEDWRRLKMAGSSSGFAEFMSAEDIVNPPGVADVLQKMFADQTNLRSKQMAAMNELINFKPPNSTKQKIYDWHQRLIELNKEMDALNQKYLKELHKEYEKVCQQCLEEVARIQASWREMGIADEEAMRRTVEEELLPVINKKQKALEKVLEKMDKNFEQYAAAQENEIKALFKYAQGTANVWDCHEVALTKAERQLLERLESTRKEHDSGNQEKEAQLDQQLDRLRQEATEPGLAESLKVVGSILEKIKECYESFHGNQLEIVQGYPDNCQKELEKYDEEVVKFFGLSRKSPMDIEMERREGDAAAAATAAAAEAQGETVESLPPPGPSETIPLASDGAEVTLEYIILETIATAKGHLFYCLAEAPKAEVSETASRASKTPAPSVNGGDSRKSSAAVGGASKPTRKTSAATKEGEEDGATASVAEGGEEEADEEPQGADVEAAAEVASHVLDNVLISPQEYEDLKKRLRQGFLDHLDTWPTEALDRANSVVTSKTEELNSELDLKLHLHEPRFKRAEIDVHHVRAAELVLHQERVTRHSKGVANTLADVKVQFNDLTQEHQKMVDQFKVNIDNLESVYTNATKSAKLVALQNQLQNMQIKFMNQIRTSLRDYRKKLDETLQRLRESNAKFVRSFKLFSDGGNYCPEEIEDFRKRLEKLTQRVNQTETSVLADLEGLEGRRQEQVSDINTKFEDRFKHHMVDLLFLEKLGRWLTNTQVKIKSEVASSNRQSEKLREALNTLTRRVDACKNPNMDKEFVPSSVLVESLPTIFANFKERVNYLHCLVSPVAGSSPSGKVTVMSGGGESRVESRLSTVGQGGQTAQASLDAQINPTAGLNLVKNILGGKGQGFRLDQDKDDESQHTQRPSQPLSPAQLSVDVSARLSSLGKAGSKTNTSKGGSKIDRKYQLFGPNETVSADGSVDPNTYFLGIVTRILGEAQEGLLATAEAFYRQKGSRTITRTNQIQENFDQCADVITSKLQNYNQQAKTYHNSCVLEIREQLERFETSVAEIPPVVIEDVRRRQSDQLRKRLNKMQTTWGKKADELEQQRLKHHRALRPNLGHPHLNPDLQALVDAEEERKVKMEEGLAASFLDYKTLLVGSAEGFVNELSSKAHELLLLFDDQITIDEVSPGKVESEKLDTCDLLRRRVAGQTLQRDVTPPLTTRGRGAWLGLPTGELVDRAQNGPETVSLQASAPAPAAGVPGKLWEDEEMRTEFYPASLLDGVSADFRDGTSPFGAVIIPAAASSESQYPPSSGKTGVSSRNGEDDLADSGDEEVSASPASRVHSKESLPERESAGTRPSSKLVDTVIAVKAVLSETLQTLKRTLGHEATVIARNKAYEEYKEFFLSLLVAMEGSQATSTSEACRWNDSWAQSVTQIQLLYQETPMIQLIRPKTVEKEIVTRPTTREGEDGELGDDPPPADD